MKTAYPITRVPLETSLVSGTSLILPQTESFAFVSEGQAKRSVKLVDFDFLGFYSQIPLYHIAMLEWDGKTYSDTALSANNDALSVFSTVFDCVQQFRKNHSLYSCAFYLTGSDAKRKRVYSRLTNRYLDDIENEWEVRGLFRQLEEADLPNTNTQPIQEPFVRGKIYEALIFSKK